MCLVYILCYKIWKIKYWYPLISKLAFNCQEFNIARYFIKKMKLEFKMITMLIICKKKNIIRIFYYKHDYWPFQRANSRAYTIT